MANRTPARGRFGVGANTGRASWRSPMAARRRSMDRSRGLASRLFASRIAWQLRHLIWRLFGNRERSLEHRACRNHGQLYLRTCFRQEGETWFRTGFQPSRRRLLRTAFSLRPSRPAIQRLLISFALRRRMARSRSWSFLFTGERTTGRPLGRARALSPPTFKRS